MSLSDADVAAAVSQPDPCTKDFVFQQTMLRIKDPKASLDFYTRVMGMRLLTKYDFPSMTFTLYFLGYEKEADIPSDPVERTKWVFMRRACLELTHNWGTENDPNFSHHNFNSEPKGFGHIGVAVPDVYKACERFDNLGIPFVKKPDGGKMKGIAFIQDPDGYWIEILNGEGIADICHK
ncbi:predicted protein [Nematostella vectensis]|uniref:lactoylglutathione lyase n=1 Tax=Nematostella vectensis TaxID=45351 RepID=A7S7N5_NEMVE|nr:predicted protein [Nematostella vectensis]EDO40227.1 predicted protein [Nematostella vectensis]|eukprot:XP_001621246.1 hypothetical protein NEMVEDRAFT_v1g237677 [Nematostella vectensis]